MIKNWLVMAGGVLTLLSSCQAKERFPGALQGVVEFEERDLSFEVPGRLLKLDVQEGDRLEPNAPIALLDAALEQAARVARQREAESAAAQLALVQAGARIEDVQAMRAELQALAANKTQLEKNLERERSLLEKGASTQVVVDDLASRIDALTAQSRALEYRISGLVRGARKEEVKSATARAEAAQQAVVLEEKRLLLHELLAPLKATVLDVHARSGEVVGAGSPVVTIADTGHPYAEVFVHQAQARELAIGTPAVLFVDAYSHGFAARIEHVSRQTEFTPRYLFSSQERPNLVVRVRVRIEDPEERLVAGVPAFVRLGDKL